MSSFLNEYERKCLLFVLKYVVETHIMKEVF